MCGACACELGTRIALPTVVFAISTYIHTYHHFLQCMFNTIEVGIHSSGDCLHCFLGALHTAQREGII